VQAFFEDERATEAAAIDKGNLIGVDCVVEGKMMNVLLKKCSIAKNPKTGQPFASGTADPAPSAAQPRAKKKR
jgi:hypothetical protein